MVRIANVSTPSECNQNGFSQSACGFVVEFTDIITTHNMNSTKTNKGGWPESAMYKFLNDDSLNGESGKELSIINSLPNELKSVIIDTKTVSSNGSEDTKPFESPDKLYLLSTAEIWSQGTSHTISSDTARDKTRQLDYYKIKGVTTSSKDGAIKKNKNSEGTDDWWWLRSANSNRNNSFYSVSFNGYWGSYYANYTGGVSPAFRIG